MLARDSQKTFRNFMMIKLILLLIPVYTFAYQPQPADYDKIYSECLNSAGITNNSSVAYCSEMTSDNTKKK